MKPLPRMSPGSLLVFALAIVCGCRVDRNEVAGVYTTKYTHGSETLILATNGSFTQVYTLVGGQPAISNSGSWEFWADESEVLLRDAVDVHERTPQKTKSVEKVTIQLRVAKRFGKFSLIWGETGVEEYDKKK